MKVSFSLRSKQYLRKCGINQPYINFTSKLNLKIVNISLKNFKVIVVLSHLNFRICDKIRVHFLFAIGVELCYNLWCKYNTIKFAKT